jgi:lactoylglutathione lyase
MGNVQQAVPFFRVSNMQASLRFYVDGLGFQIYQQWDPDDSIRWCWLKRDNAGLMLQDQRTDSGTLQTFESKPGVGVTIVFVCEDALAIYREAIGRGLQASKPFVGNGMWVTSLEDPDGYRIDFESYTDVPEDTEYTG